MLMTLEDGLYQVSGGSRILKSGFPVCTLSWVQCNKVAPMKKIEMVWQQGGFQAPWNTWNPSRSTTV